jgi:hypothetical protein
MPAPSSHPSPCLPLPSPARPFPAVKSGCTPAATTSQTRTQCQRTLLFVKTARQPTSGSGRRPEGRPLAWPGARGHGIAARLSRDCAPLLALLLSFALFSEKRHVHACSTVLCLPACLLPQQQQQQQLLHTRHHSLHHFMPPTPAPTPRLPCTLPLLLQLHVHAVNAAEMKRSGEHSGLQGERMGVSQGTGNARGCRGTLSW